MPEKVMIPPLGTVLELHEPWTFTLYWERRNKTLGTALGIKAEAEYHWCGYGSGRLTLPDGSVRSVGSGHAGAEYNRDIMDVTFPAGTILRVDRIYIRRGAGEFDSVSFYVKDCPGGMLTKKTARFWAKLADVNRMVVEFLS